MNDLVVIKTVLLITTLLISTIFFLKLRTKIQLFSYNIVVAFFISFLIEMYGLIISFYIFDIYYSSSFEYHYEYVVTFGRYVGTPTFIIGFILIGIGWYQIYHAKGKLVTKGLYRYCRHPQYLGLILFCLGFCIQYPLLFSIIILPFVIVLYYFLAKAEEKQLINRYGVDYLLYRREVPMFF
ncbi:MAG TPA: methyltransferase [Candidatus Deferrimicrobium sp.]|nr:methyltransferase [Candidatus Deferrimicrobium sp.]